jgi:hypothetical protein
LTARTSSVGGRWGIPDDRLEVDIKEDETRRPGLVYLRLAAGRCGKDAKKTASFCLTSTICPKLHSNLVSGYNTRNLPTPRGKASSQASKLSFLKQKKVEGQTSSLTIQPIVLTRLFGLIICQCTQFQIGIFSLTFL